uniref:Uncharacterized protein n=1 Tax=Entomoneis paludosa TaxID=265537 RepID=A0A7S3DVI8_9STRA
MAMFFADESSLKIGKSKKPEALKPRQNIPWKEGWTAPQTLPPLQDATGSTNEQQVATPHLPVNHPNNRQRDTESHSLFLQRASYTLTPSLKNEILRLIQWKINRSQERQKRSGKEREPLTSKETELQTIHAKVETVLQNCTKEQKACLSQMQANNAEAMKHALDTFNEKQEEGERALEEKFSALEADIEAKNTANFSASNLEILGQVTEVRKAKKICDDAKKICVDAKKNCVDAKKATEDASASCHLAESKCKDAQKACSQDKVACGQYKESCSQDKEACHEEKMSLFEKGYALLREKVQEVLSARGFVESKDKSPEPSPNQASFKEKSEIVVENELEFDKTGTDPVALSRKDKPVHKGKHLSSTPRQKKGRNNRGNENKIVTESEPKTRARKDKKRLVVVTGTTVKKRFKATLSQQSGASDTSSYTPKPRSVGRKKAAMSMVTPVDSGKRKAQALRNISPTTRLSKQSADDPKRTRSQRIRFVPSKQSCDDDFSFLSSEK